MSIQIVPPGARPVQVDFTKMGVEGNQLAGQYAMLSRWITIFEKTSVATPSATEKTIYDEMRQLMIEERSKVEQEIIRYADKARAVTGLVGGSRG